MLWLHAAVYDPAGGTPYRHHAADSQKVCCRLGDTVVQRFLRRQTASGPYAGGAGCERAALFNGQCATAYCGGTANALCGTCAAQPAEGDLCARSLCGPGQNWVAATMTNDPCGNGQSCVGASSTGTEGTCEVALGTVGGACAGSACAS
jgi:hypothetical protein